MLLIFNILLDIFRFLELNIFLEAFKDTFTSYMHFILVPRVPIYLYFSLNF